MNGCVNKSKLTYDGGDNFVKYAHSGWGSMRSIATGMNGTQPQSTSNPSNHASSSNGNSFPKMDQSNPPIRSEEKAITIFNKSDYSILSKPDSTHSSLIFRDDCDSFFNVSINNWTMLETLVIGNRCCSSTKSFEIRDCPQLKSIKVGQYSFKDSSCTIKGIEL